MQAVDLEISDIDKIFSARPPGMIGNYVSFAVLVPLVRKRGGLNLVFEVRAAGLKRQPGEICFPGGRIEDGETGEECAVRETAEELGIAPGAIRVIAQLDSLHTYSNSTLYSFLGEIDDEALAGAKINSREVESIFCVPLGEFIESDPFVYRAEVRPVIRDDFPYEMINFADGYDWSKGVSEVPIYKLGDKIIWGLTARVTQNLAEILRENL